MTPDQLEPCMAKMPPRVAEAFARLHREADERMSEAWRLRKLAWEIYRPYRKGVPNA